MNISIQNITSPISEQEQLQQANRDERYSHYDPGSGVLVISDISPVRQSIGDF